MARRGASAAAGTPADTATPAFHEGSYLVDT